MYVDRLKVAYYDEEILIKPSINSTVTIPPQVYPTINPSAEVSNAEATNDFLTTSTAGYTNDASSSVNVTPVPNQSAYSTRYGRTARNLSYLNEYRR